MLNSVGALQFVKDMNLDCSDVKEVLGLGFFCYSVEVNRYADFNQSNRITEFILRFNKTVSLLLLLK